MSRKAKIDAWMPLYVAEWDLSTGHLTNEQDGAYGRLVRWYWRQGAPLPDDDEALASIVRVDVRTWRKALRPKLAPFFTVADGFWRHARVDATLAEWGDRRAKASEKAAKAAAGRWTEPARDAARQARSTARSDASSIPSSTGQALHMQCPSSSSTEEEDPSGSSSLSGGAAVRSSVPADVRAAFADGLSLEWERSYIAPSGWIEATRTLVPVHELAAGVIVRDARRVLAWLADEGRGVTVDPKARAA